MSINPAQKTYGHISFKTVCDECGKARSAGSHKKCSKARQVRAASPIKQPANAVGTYQQEAL